MSDTQAAMREYRFLDDKRKTGGLSADEEQRWQYLGVSLGIVVPPEPQGQWGTDGLWYPAPLPPQQQGPGVWDPGLLGLGYDPNSGAYWDPAAQAWYQDQSLPQGAPGEAAAATEQAAWSALPADKSVGDKAPWRSVTQPAPAPDPVPADDGPMEVSDDEVMEVSDDDVQLIGEPEPPRPVVKIPPAPRPAPPASKATAAVVVPAAPRSEPFLSKMPSSGLFEVRPIMVPKAPPPEPVVAKPAAVVAPPRVPTPPPAPVAPPPAAEVAPPRVPTPPPAPVAPPPAAEVAPPRVPTPPPAPVAPPPAAEVAPPRVPTPPPAPVAPPPAAEVAPPRVPTPPPAPVAPPPAAEVAPPRVPTPPPPPAPAPVPAPEPEVFVVRGTGSAAAPQAPGRPIPLTNLAPVVANEGMLTSPGAGVPTLQVSNAEFEARPAEPFATEQGQVLESSVHVSPDLYDDHPHAPPPPTESEPSVHVSPDLFDPPPPAEPEPSVHVSPDLFDTPAQPPPAEPESSVQVSPDLFDAPPPAEPESSVHVSPDLFDAPPPAAEPAPVPTPSPSGLNADDLFGTPLPPTDPVPVPTPSPSGLNADDLFGAPLPPEPVATEPAAPAADASDFFSQSPAPAEAAPPEISDAPAAAAFPGEAETDDIPVDDFGELPPAPMPSAPLPITVDEAEFRAAAHPPPPAAEEEELVLQGTIEEEFDVAPPLEGTAQPDPSAPEPKVEIDEEPLPLEATVDLSGSADEKLELASTSDFVTGQFGSNPAMEVSSQFSDDGEMVLENAPAAVLANPGVDFSGSAPDEGDDAPIPLATNADFLDNPELTGTGEKWERTAQPMNDWDEETVRRKPLTEQPAPAPESEEELVMGEIIEDEELSLPPPPLAPPAAAPMPAPRPAPMPAAKPALMPAPAPMPPPDSGLVAAPAVRPAANVKPLAKSTAPNKYPTGNLTAGANAAKAAAEPASPPGSSYPNLPVVLEGEHRVIVHTVEGQVKRGALKNQDLGGKTLDLHGPVKEQIPLAKVKAIFFMLSPGAEPPPQLGRKVRVTFRDGRQVAGFSADHDRAALGLFVVPADNRTNTARIFVYRHAVQSVGVD